MECFHKLLTYNINMLGIMQMVKCSLTLTVLVVTIHAQWEGWGCRVGEVRAGTTSPMPDHKGFKLQ